MKRSALLRHLRQHGCWLKREGKEHSLWAGPHKPDLEAVPRHQEIANTKPPEDLPGAWCSRDRSRWLAERLKGCMPIAD